MKNAAIGLCLGVFLTGAVWLLTSLPGPRSSPTQLPQDYELNHPTDGLAPDAKRSIEAFKAIASSLEQGRLSGVREHALEIARFFAPMNPEIERSARRLAQDTELQQAKTHFRELTEAFQSPAPPQTDAFEL